MKKSLVALSFLILSSCTVEPKSVVPPEEIAKFAETIKNADLVFVQDNTLKSFEIASDGTYTDGEGTIYQISQIIDETTVLADSVDFGKQTHELLDEVYGITFQEIAFKKATPEEILDFKAIIDARGLISEQGGYWQNFSINLDGTYTTGGVTYEIAKFIDDTTVLVVKSDGGIETHQLVSTDFGSIDANGVISKEIAFQRATQTQITEFTAKLDNFIFAKDGAWASLTVSGSSYTDDDDITYDIGKIINGTSTTPIALVAKSSGGIEKHKLIGEVFGPIVAGGISKLAFKGSSLAEINTFTATLNNFIFAKNGAWSPLTITGGDTYTDADGIAYNIGRVDSTTILVVSTAGLATHGIRDSKFGPIDETSGDITAIAFKGSTPEEIKIFTDKLAGFVYAGTSTWVDLQKDDIFYKDDIKYTVGRVDGNTALVARVGGIETHELKNVDSGSGEDMRLGEIKSDSTFREIAFKKATTEEIKFFAISVNSKTLIFEKGGRWVDFKIITPNGTYTDKNDTTYTIGRIDDSVSPTIAIVISTKGIETHSVKDKEYGAINNNTIAEEIAFKRATDNEINNFTDKLIGFVDSTEWNPLIVTGTTYPINNETYDIGKIIDATSVLVAKTGGGTEIHTITTDGKSLSSSSDYELAFKRATQTDVLNFVTSTLEDFRSATAGRWEPVTSTFITYTLHDVKYHVYKIKDNTATIVEDGTLPTIFENRKEHLIIDGTNYADKTTPTIPLAIRRNNTTDKDNIESFAQRITALNLTRKDPTTSVTTSFLIADDGQYTHSTSTYEIGRLIDNNTVLVVNSTTRTVETNGIRGDKYGGITQLDNVIVDPVIAEVSPLDMLKDKLSGFKYAENGSWNNFPEKILPSIETGVLGTYKVGGVTYKIKDIDGDKVYLENNITHNIDISSGQYGPYNGVAEISFGTEIAVIPTDLADIKTYTDLLNNKNLIYPTGNTTYQWTKLTITANGLITWIDNRYQIGRIETPISLDSKILVSSTVSGGTEQEVHQFEDPTYFNYEPPNYTAKRDDLAFKKITDSQRDAFRTKVNGLGLVIKDTVAPFKIEIDGNNYAYYTYDGITYPIGRYVDKDTIYVSLGGLNLNSNMAKHGLKTDSIGNIEYGILNDDSTMKTVIAEYKGVQVGSGPAIGGIGNNSIYIDLELKFQTNGTDNILYLASKTGNALNLSKFDGSSWENVKDFSKSVQSPSLAFHPTTKKATIAYKAGGGTPQKPIVIELGMDWNPLGGALITENDSGNHITLAYKGSIPHVAYWVNIEGKLYVKKFKASDSTWTSVYPEDDTKNVKNLDFQSSGTDLFIAYNNTSTAFKVRKMDDSGNTWKKMTPDNGSGVGGTIDQLFLALHGDKPYVAYQKGNEVFVKKHTSGTTWVDVGGVVHDDVETFRFEVDKNGIPYILYKDEDTEKLSLKKHNGSEWVFVSEDFVEIAEDYISLAIDRYGVPYVAYGNNDGPVYVRKFLKHE